MTSLREKGIQGVQWNFISGFLAQGVNFITGIILARLLAPSDFGSISLILVVTAFLDLFIDGGFSQALIRKFNCTQRDYSTVFFFNLIISIALYLAIFFSAGYISIFFNLTNFVSVFRVVGLSVIISAFTQVQYTILQIKMDYKSQFIIALTASICSGLTGIILAFSGYGVWSLVWQLLAYKIINCILLWLLCRWKPSMVFDKISFKEMFGFGSRLLAAGFVNTLFNNFYYIIIGKMFSPADLGYFGRAEQIANLPSSNLTRVIVKVFGPILASIKHDSTKLKSAFKSIIRLTMFLTFFIMLTIIACSRAFILVFFTNKWEDSIIYLQLLSFTMMLYPLQTLNITMIGIAGRSDLILKLELYKKIIIIPVLLSSFFFSIQLMLSFMIVFSFAAYFLNSYYSTKVMDYPIKEQMLDILPSFSICLTASLFTWVFGAFLENYFVSSQILILLLQIFFSIISAYALASILKNRDLLEIKKIVKDKLPALNFAKWKMR